MQDLRRAGRVRLVNTDILSEALERARRRRELPDARTRRLTRARAGITQIDLARALGVDRATVSRWESGDRNPDGELLVAYLDALAQMERAAS